MSLYDLSLHKKHLLDIPKEQLELEKSIILTGLNKSPICILLESRHIYKVRNSWYCLRDGHFFKYMPMWNKIYCGRVCCSSLYYNGFFHRGILCSYDWILGFIDNPINNITYFKSIIDSSKMHFGRKIIDLINKGKIEYVKLFIEKYSKYIDFNYSRDIILGLGREQDILFAQYIVRSAMLDQTWISRGKTVAENRIIRQIVHLLGEKLRLEISATHILIVAMTIFELTTGYAKILANYSMPLDFINILTDEWNKLPM